MHSNPACAILPPLNDQVSHSQVYLNDDPVPIHQLDRSKKWGWSMFAKVASERLNSVQRWMELVKHGQIGFVQSFVVSSEWLCDPSEETTASAKRTKTRVARAQVHISYLFKRFGSNDVCICLTLLHMHKSHLRFYSVNTATRRRHTRTEQL